MLNGNSENGSRFAAAVNLPPTSTPSAAAFESAALPHLNGLYQTAFHMLHQPTKASRAVQTTYLRAWKTFAKYPSGATCRAWLFQILVDVVRHERRNDVGRHSKTSFAVPVDLMDVLLLVDGQDFSYREAAEILGLSTDVVRRRVVLGRSHLHSEMEACSSTRDAVAETYLCGTKNI
jgi:DNA-directed RNA polymerase specialized sigma24 family protein